MQRAPSENPKHWRASVGGEKGCSATGEAQEIEPLPVGSPPAVPGEFWGVAGPDPLFGDGCGDGAWCRQHGEVMAWRGRSRSLALPSAPLASAEFVAAEQSR